MGYAGSMNKDFELEHPYRDITAGQWLRGNLHTHSNRSDGDLVVDEVFSRYREAGYDFLMMSDHDVYSSREWLDGLDSKGLILIPGNEISAKGPHILHVNAGKHVQPDDNRQNVLDRIGEDTGSFAIICHPNYLDQFDYVSMDQLKTWKGYTGIEIYNGVIRRLNGSSYALNKWDMLLAQGRRVWGYANDDSHRRSEFALGWNHVFVKERTPEAIVDSLRKGRFYASTGVEITGISVDGGRVRIETSNAERIAAICNVGRRIAQVDDAVLEMEIPLKLSYLRFECWGRGESMAWTQPLFLTAKGSR